MNRRKTPWERIKEFIEDYRVWDRQSKRARGSLGLAA